jgi:hypothetical protein
MTKKDIPILLCPCIVFAIVGICAFLLSHTIERYQEFQHAPESQQKFDTFVTNMVSGKSQLTPDRWIMVLRSSRSVAEAEQKINASTGKEVLDFVWLAAVGIFWQSAAVFIVVRRLRKHHA